MGMTDMQFKTHLRSLIARLESAKQAKDWALVEALQAELRQALED